MNVVRSEFAKLRHLHVGALGALMAVAVSGLTFVGTLSAATADGAANPSWALPLAGLSLAFPVVSPLLIAVIASRTVEVEHHGNGWLLNRTSGISSGQLVRAKLVSAGLIVVLATITASIAAAIPGALLDTAGTVPVGPWLGYTASVAVVNIIVLAVHLSISAMADNQLIALGVGILGTVVAICASGFPSWLAHLTPWGYYSVTSVADYRGGQAVTLTPSYMGVTMLTLVGVAVFLFSTVRLDHQEVSA